MLEIKVIPTNNEHDTCFFNVTIDKSSRLSMCLRLTSVCKETLFYTSLIYIITRFKKLISLYIWRQGIQDKRFVHRVIGICKRFIMVVLQIQHGSDRLSMISSRSSVRKNWNYEGIGDKMFTIQTWYLLVNDILKLYDKTSALISCRNWNRIPRQLT